MESSLQPIKVVLAPGSLSSRGDWERALSPPDGVEISWCVPPAGVWNGELSGAAAVVVEWPLPEACRLPLNSPDLAIIAVGKDVSTLAVEALRQGSDDYIPAGSFCSETLRKSIRIVLDRKRNPASPALPPPQSETLREGWWEWDLESDALRISQLWCALLGAASVDKPWSAVEWWRIVHPHHRKELKEQIQAIREGTKSYLETEFRLRRSDEEQLWVCFRGVLQPGTRMLRGSITNITERKLTQERLLRELLQDSITGLPGRVILLDRLERVCARHQRNPSYRFTLLIMDLDRFHLVNESMGLHFGDKLLEQIARRLQAALRSTDTVARLGADQFVVLVEDIPERQSVEYIATRLQRCVERPIQLEGREVILTSSVGGVLSTAENRTPEEYLRAADVALESARESGSGAIRFFSTSLQQKVLEAFDLEHCLRQALEAGQFRTFLQPILDLRSRNVTGFEALARWDHPEKGWIRPLQFVPVAEQTGLIRPLDRLIMEQACRELTRQTVRKLPKNWTLSVNFSALHFLDRSAPAQVREILNRTGFEPERLRVEITETVFLRNTPDTVSSLEELRKMGIRIAIDDFGTGFSALARLDRLPVDVIKIDRSFISQFDQPKGREILGAIIHLAQRLSLDVVAEGIETREQAEYLEKLGCEYAQGFLFARPLTAPEFRAFVRAAGSDRRQGCRTDVALLSEVLATSAKGVDAPKHPDDEDAWYRGTLIPSLNC